jgi:hypothetical protein
MAKSETRKATRVATAERRKGQECKTFELKIQEDSMNSISKENFNMYFVEAK